MTNKKKRVKAKANSELPSGSLRSGLANRAARRQVQRAMFIRFEPLSIAFDEVLMQFQVLSRVNELKPEISHLLEEAQRWIIDGVDRALTGDASNEIEEARKLLELEHLLLDFAATPMNLDEWVAMEPWKRQSKFGFGELRRREERRQGLDEDMVIAARDYWITHSIHSHPKPLKNEALPSSDQSRLLLLLLCDLLGHATSAVYAATKYAESQEIIISREFTSLSTNAIDVSWNKMHEVLHAHIPKDLLEATRRPHPRKQIFPYPIQNNDSESGTDKTDF